MGGDNGRSMVEFRWLEARLVGSDTVTFRLEDGALVKVKVDIDRAGVAVNHTNPDGTPHYHIDASLKVTVTPHTRKFYIPRSELPPLPTSKKKNIIA